MFESDRRKRALVMGLMLGLGVVGKTVWDVVSAPAPQPVARPSSSVPSEEVELAPLPSLPQPPKRAKKTKVARTGRRVVPAPALPAPVLEEVPAAAPVLAAVAAPAVVPEPEAELELSAPPLVAGIPDVVPEPAPVEEPEPSIALDDGNGASIARAIANAKRRAVQTCFERELKRTPTLEGRVMVELELAPPQKVVAVRVSDDLERPELTRCVTATMQQLQFTGLNEEVSIQLPYLLSARRK